MRAQKADLGVACDGDGDGDRVIFIDESGAVVPGDAITALRASEFLRREHGATILYDLRSSHSVHKRSGSGDGAALGRSIG